MSRVNTNVDSLVAMNNLNKSSNKLSVSLTRLSTGLKINSGKDDPAGLIQGEFLRQEISSSRSAVANNNRANNLLSTTDAALGEIGNLLDDVRGILTTAANKGVLSQDEITANQAAVDSAVSSITRIASNTQFAGKKLLDGNLGFELSGVSKDATADNFFSDVKVFRNNFNATGDAVTVSVEVTADPTQATVTLDAATAGADSVIEVTGSKGSATISIADGQDVDDAINAVSDTTGITAAGAVLTSTDYGENAAVKVRNITGDLMTDSELTDQGSNAVGTINGQSFSSDGLKATLKTAALEVEVTFSAPGAGTLVGAAETFQITGGGAQFQLGLEINSASQINVGFGSFLASSLGHSNNTDGDRTLQSITTGGSNSLVNDRASIAADIVKEAIGQVSGFRSRIGALQKYTIESNINSLQVGIENLSAARSQIVDADFAEETANLTRSQILVQAGTSVLSIANSRPQSALALLGG